MTEFLFADAYDFNNPRGVFVRSKAEVEANPAFYPKVGEHVILYTNDDDEGFGIVVTVTEISPVDENIVYKTDYPERTWRKSNTTSTNSSTTGTT